LNHHSEKVNGLYFSAITSFKHRAGSALGSQTTIGSPLIGVLKLRLSKKQKAHGCGLFEACLDDRNLVARARFELTTFGL
jgi:hypothetical protein